MDKSKENIHKICILLCKYYCIQFSFILSNNSQLKLISIAINRSLQNTRYLVVSSGWVKVGRVSLTKKC